MRNKIIKINMEKYRYILHIQASGQYTLAQYIVIIEIAIN